MQISPDTKLNRFSSCRGVAFEIKVQPYSDPAPVTDLPRSSTTTSLTYWFPRASFLRVFPSQRSTSSHFCDLDNDGEFEDAECLSDIESSHFEQPVLTSDPAPANCTKKSSSNSRLSVILLDQGLFTVYKRLFVLTLAVNITCLILSVTGKFPYARSRAALFSIANIFALTLCRSEAFLRIIFWLAVNVLGWPWIPLRIKTMVTSLLQSLGGIHSGCGVSSIAWLVYALVLTFQESATTPPEIFAVACAILVLLCLSSLAAFPVVRHVHHNIFERTHRFAGWTALLLLWIFVTLTVSYEPETNSYCDNLGSRLPKRKEFWFTIGITVLIIIPWMSVRKVPVKISSPSGHASIIKFEGGIKPGILGRISPSPFSEWHAFGIISDGKTEHMMLAGAVGDFTKSLVTNPPTHLWIRRVHFAGLPYLTNMYNRVLLVATGSGICVFLSFLRQPCPAEICLIWVAKGVEQNFGKEIKEWVSGHPKDRVIVHDTAVLGRPDVAQMSMDTARTFAAEVVIVTSNPEGSRDVVNACKAAGIAAFGPTWDS